MPRKNANNPANIVRTMAEQVIGSPDQQEIQPVTASLLTELRTGMAIGLIGKSPTETDLNNPNIAAGIRAGQELRGIAERNGKSEATLWRDMARHGEVSGRFGSAEECRPTLVNADEEQIDWLIAIWQEAFSIGAQAREEVRIALES